VTTNTNLFPRPARRYVRKRLSRARHCLSRARQAV